MCNNFCCYKAKYVLFAMYMKILNINIIYIGIMANINIWCIHVVCMYKIIFLLYRCNVHLYYIIILLYI